MLSGDLFGEALGVRPAGEKFGKLAQAAAWMAI
jgi:hypothetical protein